MAGAVRTAERTQEKRQGLIGKTLGLPFRILAVLLGSLILSLVFEWIGLAFFWSAEGWNHSLSMFNRELGWLSENFRQSLIFQQPGQTVAYILDQVYEWAFVKSGFIDFTKQAAINSQQGGVLGTMSSVYLAIEDYVLASIYTVLTFTVRLMVLVLSIPLFILAVLVGATDGLMRRDLRKFGAGRESSFVYHRARNMIVPLLIAPWFIYLACPVSIHPILVLVPCAFALGLAVLITTSTFKKYL
jgi:integrating conjugative element membrane protein, PFL_4697 family